MVLVMSVCLPTAETKAQLSLGSLFMVSFFSLSLTIDFPLFFSDLLLPLSIFFTIFYSLTLLFPVFSLSVSLSPHFHALNKLKVSERDQAKCQGQKTFVHETVAVCDIRASSILDLLFFLQVSSVRMVCDWLLVQFHA